MRPTPIPDDEIFADHHRLVIGPPRGLEWEIAPVEALHTVDPKWGPIIRVRLVVEGNELDRFAKGEPIWLSMYSDRLTAFSVQMAEPS